MTDTFTDSVEVVNGYVRVGDTVAYPVRWGSTMDMKLARVKSVERIAKYAWEKDDPTADLITVLKVRVFGGSDFNWQGNKPDEECQYDTTIRVLDRVVKLNG